MSDSNQKNYLATYCQSMHAQFLINKPRSNFYAVLEPVDGNRDVADQYISATDYLMNRHPILGTTYDVREDGVLCSPNAVPIDQYCSQVEAAGWKKEQILAYVREYYDGIDTNLLDGPTTRTFIFFISPSEFVFVLTTQHIAFDAYSAIIFKRELETLLDCGESGYQSALPAIRYDYSEYAKWEEDLCKSAEAERRASYWSDVLNHCKPVVDLPTDFSGNQAHPPGLRPLHLLSKKQTELLKAVAQNNDCNINSLMFCAHMIMLSLFSGQEKIAIATPFSKRHVNANFIRVIGNFLDYIPIVAAIKKSDTIHQAINSVLQAFDTAQKNYLPLGRIFELQGMGFLDQPTPLLQCYVNCIPSTNNTPPPLLSCPEEGGLMVASGSSPERKEMALFFSDYDNQLRWRICKRADLFKDETMRRAETTFLAVLASMLDQSAGSDLSKTKIGEISEKYPADDIQVTVRSDC